MQQLPRHHKPSPASDTRRTGCKSATDMSGQQMIKERGRAFHDLRAQFEMTSASSTTPSLTSPASSATSPLTSAPASGAWRANSSYNPSIESLTKIMAEMKREAEGEHEDTATLTSSASDAGKDAAANERDPAADTDAPSPTPPARSSSLKRTNGIKIDTSVNTLMAAQAANGVDMDGVTDSPLPMESPLVTLARASSIKVKMKRVAEDAPSTEEQSGQVQAASTSSPLSKQTVSAAGLQRIPSGGSKTTYRRPRTRSQLYSKDILEQASQQPGGVFTIQENEQLLAGLREADSEADDEQTEGETSFGDTSMSSLSSSMMGIPLVGTKSDATPPPLVELGAMSKSPPRRSYSGTQTRRKRIFSTIKVVSEDEMTEEMLQRGDGNTIVLPVKPTDASEDAATGRKQHPSIASVFGREALALMEEKARTHSLAAGHATGQAKSESALPSPGHGQSDDQASRSQPALARAEQDGVAHGRAGSFDELRGNAHGSGNEAQVPPVPPARSASRQRAKPIEQRQRARMAGTLADGLGRSISGSVDIREQMMQKEHNDTNASTAAATAAAAPTAPFKLDDPTFKGVRLSRQSMLALAALKSPTRFHRISSANYYTTDSANVSKPLDALTDPSTQRRTSRLSTLSRSRSVELKDSRIITDVIAEADTMLQLAEAAEKRRMVVSELVNTEAAFAADLDVLIEVYHDAAKASPLFRPLDVRVLFTNIEDVRVQAHIFVEELAEVSKMIPKSDGKSYIFKLPTKSEAINDGGCIGNVFIDQLKRMEHVYTEYCKRYDTALERLQDLESQSQYQRFFMEQLAGKTTSWDLGSLLIKPVQRVLKYPLLVQEILKHTDAEHADHRQLLRLSGELQNMADRINEVKRRKEVVEGIIR
ncbi:hypothetical protein SYNPS1DRAFT_23622 [Syncephalis pseudoplumigaleata]|uniref:DH domain-containing protein n=1 Tax=Syncephalis pseudoplumigaleata TaxID=1712513 RepID=A0A4P9YW93_9FUNG|nr:hypothetical protein SYNPS1DRAFT_23622 [Syncephalis pseudoplumigaleata]|eukprot:RKP24287.1 hypothetical protein SYNPS1DRAFT_23622 [Syncephalis pseudoplumigaleata]